MSIEDIPEAEGTARVAAADAFTGWADILAASLREHGAEAGAADSAATLIVAALEGSLAMCRAERSTVPLDRIGGQLDALVRSTIAPAPGR